MRLMILTNDGRDFTVDDIETDGLIRLQEMLRDPDETLVFETDGADVQYFPVRNVTRVEVSDTPAPSIYDRIRNRLKGNRP